MERYFKILTYSPSIQEVIDSLSPLMQALQMIWIISRYFSKDDRMTVLFEEIAWCLCNRASHMLDFSELFRYNVVIISHIFRVVFPFRIWESVLQMQRSCLYVGNQHT